MQAKALVILGRRSVSGIRSRPDRENRDPADDRHVHVHVSNYYSHFSLHYFRIFTLKLYNGYLLLLLLHASFFTLCIVTIALVGTIANGRLE